MAWKYGEIAFKKCKNDPRINEKDINFKGFCGIFQEKLEEFFDDKGEEMRKLFLNPDNYGYTASNEEISKRALYDPYFKKKGEFTIEDILDWVLKNPEKWKNEKIFKEALHVPFFTWFSKVLKNEKSPELSQVHFSFFYFTYSII